MFCNIRFLMFYLKGTIFYRNEKDCLVILQNRYKMFVPLLLKAIKKGPNTNLAQHYFCFFFGLACILLFLAIGRRQYHLVTLSSNFPVVQGLMLTEKNVVVVFF